MLENLPEDLTSRYTQEAEEGAQYESYRELIVRMRLVASDAHPEVRELVLTILEVLQRGKELDPHILSAVPHESLPVVYFGMGALGLSALIETVLPSVRTQSELDGVAGLTKIRHLLLEANSSVPA
ncbi:hypothetical protein COU78_02750 [Candidatus Peregrinibacteria bacterium CG10_big_fil_rev_8_21_14_0_10_49_24]|nr:MAG: hypothetical protein COV83_02730 [Candidatus Peregrinibacteria bacterium CG11_big_fil_rev_8_21_14_0_20_49_14]PIR51055.1 MAG: hypothetical protein COU78_02750 [Candidatus Peregrinibacteria bacterium CG10_big_fil_rev_8_21_14_0_10_49_24]PJA67608.1 MAG: hypothetical protein CO157_04230 [Candidatus Peregrinibacteria bacterium CG_4_9_14_3_um_filter_49_12]